MSYFQWHVQIAQKFCFLLFRTFLFIDVLLISILPKTGQLSCQSLLVLQIQYLSNEQKVSALRQSKSAGLVFRLNTDHALSLLSLCVSPWGRGRYFFSFRLPRSLKKRLIAGQKTVSNTSRLRNSRFFEMNTRPFPYYKCRFLWNFLDYFTV